MTDREKLIDIILRTPCVAVSSRTAAGHIADHLIENGTAMVVYGRWEKDGICSNCKGLNPTYRANKWSAEFPDFPGHFDHLNYCPNCGAKMDGKDDE